MTVEIWSKKEHTTGVHENLGEAGCTSSPNLPENPLTEIDDTRPDGEPPALISETVFCRIERETRDVVGISGVTDEASGGMTIKTDHEEERKVVSVPEGLKALVTNLVVCGGVHQDHDEQHEVAGDTTWLGVMDVQRSLGTNLCNRRCVK